MVVSCEENNRHAPTYNCVPITTRQADHLPCHVHFVYDGRHQLIECEQITTRSINDFNIQGSNYMYTLSAELMDKVNVSLAGQLGLELRVPGIEEFEKIIERIAKAKVKESRKEVLSEDVVNRVVQSVAKAFDLKEEVAEESDATEEGDSKKAPESTSPAMQKFQRRLQKTEAVRKEREASGSKNHWSDEKIREYLKDCETMTPAELMKKYELNSKKTVYQYKYLLKKKLEG